MKPLLFREKEKPRRFLLFFEFARPGALEALP
jgi:hypothetical protein